MRALEIGEEHGHLLALALQRRPRGEDALGQVLGRVGLGRARSGQPAGCRRSATPHAPQNFLPGRVATPQLGHGTSSRTPHSSQNRTPSRFGAWQRGQFTASALGRGRARRYLTPGDPRPGNQRVRTESRTKMVSSRTAPVETSDTGTPASSDSRSRYSRAFVGSSA